ncbi:MAG: hypothetical protein DRN71_00255 [Candidatus Nanohalarchaeota archaeon]|nr:MAG: hypothetical protein DRN71_00255 [Candidatus Nanohaloarchaeota archaeon]
MVKIDLTDQDLALVSKIENQIGNVYWSISYLRGYVSPDKADFEYAVKDIQKLGETIDNQNVTKIEQSLIETYYNNGHIYYGEIDHTFNSIKEFLEISMEELTTWTEEDASQQIDKVKTRMDYAQKGENPYSYARPNERDSLLETDINRLNPDKFIFSRGSMELGTLQDLETALPDSRKTVGELQKILYEAHHKLDQIYNKIISSQD